MQLPLLQSETEAHDTGCKVFVPLPADWIAEEPEFGGPNNCYRYTLVFRWADGPLLMFLMKNPSGASHLVLDRTVKKCGLMARHQGFAGFIVVNTHAYRAKDAGVLMTVADPVGTDNLAAIIRMAKRAGRIIAAYGTLPVRLQKNSDAICEALIAAGYDLHVLALSTKGIPVHPLPQGISIPITTVPVLWKKGGI